MFTTRKGFAIVTTLENMHCESSRQWSVISHVRCHIHISRRNYIYKHNIFFSQNGTD